MKQTIERIEQLKKEKDVLVLAHFYVPDEVQAIADHLGDSYALSKIAADAEQSTILFCGVRFMGESAKILSPDKTVLLPDAEADCLMAHMITPEQVLEMKKQYPEAAVVCYINSTSETKAVCDVIVTSANAKKIVESLPNKEICFVPDCNLGRFLAKGMPDKVFHFHDGCCPIHARVRPQDILDAKEFIIVTEPGVLCELKKRNPDKTFYPLEKLGICEDMKKITLEKVLYTLETFDNQVVMEEKLREDAKSALIRMRELAQ